MLVIVLPSLQFLLGIVQREELSLLIHSIPHFLDGVISVFGYKGLPLFESGTFCIKTEMTPARPPFSGFTKNSDVLQRGGSRPRHNFCTCGSGDLHQVD